MDGFPGTKEKELAPIHQYFEIRDELSVHGGVIFKDQRCTITQTLRQKIKQKLHDSHIGSQGCLCRALETVYWPGMNAKITDYIQKCDVCMSLRNHLSVMSPHQGPGRKLPLTYSHSMTRIISAQ